MPQGSEQLTRAGANRRTGRQWLRRGTLLHQQQREKGEPHPPDTHADERPADRLGGAGKTEPLRLGEHRDVHSEQQSAAQIAQRVAVP